MKLTEDEARRTAWVDNALKRHEGPLIRYAAGITGNLDLARDVVQDTFLRLCVARRGDMEDHLAAWLYTVCRNRALDVRKKEGRMEPLREDAAAACADGGASPSSVAARNETHDLLLETLNTLPADQREAFRLKFQDGLTYREIGQVMGKSLGSVSTLITTALNTMRHRLRATMDLAQEG